jgi:hypothetical protein
MVAIVIPVPVVRATEHHLIQEHVLPEVIRLLNHDGSHWLAGGDLRIIGDLLGRSSERNKESAIRR